MKLFHRHKIKTESTMSSAATFAPADHADMPQPAPMPVPIAPTMPVATPEPESPKAGPVDPALKSYYHEVKEAVNTPQAHVYGVIFLINVAVILLAFTLVPKYRTVAILIGVVFAIPIALLMMYNVACLTKGHCNLWAWIVVILMVIAMIGNIIRGVMLASIKKTVMGSVKK